MAFSSYANRLQNYHGLQPYQPFLKGADHVVVTVSINGGYVKVEEGPDIDGYEAEIKNLKRKVKEAETEVQSLNILLEKQRDSVVGLDPTEGNSAEASVNLLMAATEPDKENKPKEKRKSRRKKKVEN